MSDFNIGVYRFRVVVRSEGNVDEEYNISTVAASLEQAEDNLRGLINGEILELVCNGFDYINNRSRG